jgi:hypothetical protein
MLMNPGGDEMRLNQNRLNLPKFYVENVISGAHFSLQTIKISTVTMPLSVSK